MAHLIGRLPSAIERRWWGLLMCNGNTTLFREHGPLGGCGVLWKVSSDDLWWMVQGQEHYYETDRVGFRCACCGTLNVFTAEDLRIPFEARRAIPDQVGPTPVTGETPLPSNVWDRLNGEDT